MKALHPVRSGKPASETIWQSVRLVPQGSTFRSKTGDTFELSARPPKVGHAFLSIKSTLFWLFVITVTNNGIVNRRWINPTCKKCLRDVTFQCCATWV